MHVRQACPHFGGEQSCWRGGRPSKVDPKKLATIKKLAASNDYTRAEIANMVGLSPATLYRVLASL